MAGRGNPSFLKRQKEQKRMERASAKRAARQARREQKAAGKVEQESDELMPADAAPDEAPATDEEPR